MTKPKIKASLPKPEPFKPKRLVFIDATSGSWALCIGTEKLTPETGSLGENSPAVGKVALCFGTNDYGDFTCDGHLTISQVDRLIAFLLLARKDMTLEMPCDGNTEYEVVR